MIKIYKVKENMENKTIKQIKKIKIYFSLKISKKSNWNIFERKKMKKKKIN